MNHHLGDQLWLSTKPLYLGQTKILYNCKFGTPDGACS